MWHVEPLPTMIGAALDSGQTGLSTKLTGFHGDEGADDLYPLETQVEDMEEDYSLRPQ